MSLFSKELTVIEPNEHRRDPVFLLETEDPLDELREVIAEMKEMLEEPPLDEKVYQIFEDTNRALLITFKTLLEHNGNYTASIQAMESALKQKQEDVLILRLALDCLLFLFQNEQESINKN